MSRQQLIVSILAVALVLLLFSLPKVLLNKEEKELVNSAELEKVDQAVSTSGAASPSKKLSTEQQAQAQKVKGDLVQATKIADKLSLLDSLSALYNALGLYDSSAIYYERYLASYQDTQSWIAMGDACYKAYYFAADESLAQDWAKRTQLYYQKALDQNQELLDVKARLAMTYTRSSNPMKAIAALREVLDKDPNNEQALLNMGLLSIQSGQYAKAVERFKKLISINPQNWLGVFYLGISYAESGQKPAAKECFEKVKRYEKQPQLIEAADEYLKQLSTN
jgi:tetratricopeptide (TPR) repeat protein